MDVIIKLPEDIVENVKQLIKTAEELNNKNNTTPTIGEITIEMNKKGIEVSENDVSNLVMEIIESANTI